MQWVYGSHNRGLNKAPMRIHYGNNSGYQALNLAYHWGARRMILLGFDCKSRAGKMHWFGDHPKPLQNQIGAFKTWLETFPPLAKDLAATGVEVVNCSRDTALTCFRRSTIDIELSCLARTA